MNLKKNENKHSNSIAIIKIVMSYNQGSFHMIVQVWPYCQCVSNYGLSQSHYCCKFSFLRRIHPFSARLQHCRPKENSKSYYRLTTCTYCAIQTFLKYLCGHFFFYSNVPSELKRVVATTMSVMIRSIQ